ncbi:hypothetical protein D3C76_1408920 [compost metagenome]
MTNIMLLKLNDIAEGIKSNAAMARKSPTVSRINLSEFFIINESMFRITKKQPSEVNRTKTTITINSISIY